MGRSRNDSHIGRFTETGIKFQNGAELPADVVVFATGYGDPKEPIRKFFGDKTSKLVERIDHEKEICGGGIPNL